MPQRLPHPFHTETSTAYGKNTFDNRSMFYARKRSKLPFWSAVIFVCIIVVSVSIHLASVLHDLQMQQGRQNGRVRVTNTVRASGFLQGRIYNLNFRASSSVIDQIDVQLGEEVHKGEVLAQLDQTIQQDNVDITQRSVDAAQNNVASALRNASQTVAEINANIAAAQTAVGVAQANKQAISVQSDANIAVAETTLRSDQAILTSIRINARALMRLAAAQLKQSLVNCHTASSLGSALLTVTPTSTASSAVHNNLTICERLAYAQYQQTMAIARTSVVIAQGQVNEDQSYLDAARATAFVNNTAARGQIAIAQSQVNVARNSAALTSALSQVVATQGQFKVTLAQYKLAVDNLQDTVLIAPAAGVITAINGTLGGYPGNPDNITAGAGTAGYGPFIRLVDAAHVNQILASVSETDIVSLKVGQVVRFSVKAYADRQFSGTVSNIIREGTNSATSVVFSIIVAINPGSVQGVVLLPNMTANLSIIVG